ncbi:DUF1007 family protein [Fulvimarina sp. MAC3]|uniref:DUF1007 family protein n=1 Tax=Fulvimarina sp. MAC3 TaxID=3148887 RepID=UPI0031FDBFA1
MARRLWMPFAIGFAAIATSQPVSAHPHVFIDARLVAKGDGAGHLTGLENVWAMDELFSSSVIPDFDANANDRLDPDELEAVGKQVRGSIAEWSYYTFVKVDGETVKLTQPDAFKVDWDEATGRLLFRFEMLLDEPVALDTVRVSLSTYDQTYFVAFDFPDESRFMLDGISDSCARHMETPEPDEAERIWLDTLAQLGPDEETPEDGINFSDALATRFEIDCRDKGPLASHKSGG